MFANRYGLSGLLKEGGRNFSGVEETALKNIENCKTLATITQTSLGPNCMNKMIINYLGKNIITSACSLILSELDVQHPAAKLAVLAAKLQDEEFGDATNFVINLFASLLSNAEKLIREGLHTSDIVKGYEAALNICTPILDELVCWHVADIMNVEDLAKGIKTCVNSKQLLTDKDLTKLIAEAALKIMPNNVADFNIDNIRVAKIVGGCANDSHLVSGMIILREPSGSVLKKTNAKVMVLGCGLEMTGTEAKGTVLLNSAQELINFTKGEEDRMEELIKSIRDAGVEAIIVNGTISDTAQHYCNKYEIFTLKITSKFETRRLCRTFGATALVRLGAPLADELGMAELISVQEIASKKVTLIRSGNSRVATIVLRGGTPAVLDEMERAIDDGINCIKCITQSTGFVAGGGAAEIEIAHQIAKKNETNESNLSDFDRMCLLKFGESFECIPKILAENAGLNSTEVITALIAAHQNGHKYACVNMKGDSLTINALEAGILDHFETKKWAIKFAVDAALTVLRIDQIIMAKPAGGPKAPQQRNDDDE